MKKLLLISLMSTGLLVQAMETSSDLEWLLELAIDIKKDIVAQEGASNVLNGIAQAAPLARIATHSTEALHNTVDFLSTDRLLNVLSILHDQGYFVATETLTVLNNIATDHLNSIISETSENAPNLLGSLWQAVEESAHYAG